LVLINTCPEQPVEKLLVGQAVEKFQVQGAKKAQTRSVVSLRESLSFLKQRSNWKIFNGLLIHDELQDGAATKETGAYSSKPLLHLVVAAV
jgi:hypothetical protein